MRSRNLVTSAALLAGTLGLGASVSLAQTSEIRQLPQFDAIEVGGTVELVVRQGSEFRVEVTSDESDLANLVTDVERGTLQIHQEPTKRGWFRSGLADDYRVYVTLPELRSIRASGGSDVEVDGRITGERLSVSASGGSDVTLSVDVQELEVRTSGGSDTRLTGTAVRLNARSSGGSDLVASQLQAEAVNVQSSGGSDVMLEVTEELVARASGGSDIVYSGNPAVVDVNASGGSDVTRL